MLIIIVLHFFFIVNIDHFGGLTLAIDGGNIGQFDQLGYNQPCGWVQPF